MVDDAKEVGQKMALEDEQEFRFMLWENGHSVLCETLEAEGVDLSELYFALKRVDRIPYIKDWDDKKFNDAVRDIQELQNIDAQIHDLVPVLQDRGGEYIDKAWSITSWSIGLDNGAFKWAFRSLSFHALKQHREKAIDYEMPDIVACPVWRELKDSIGHSLCLWHIAYLMNPCNTTRDTREREEIINHLYRVVSDQVLCVRENPLNVIGDHPINTAKVSIDDFQNAIDNGYFPKKYEYAVKLWRSFMSMGVKPIDRVENPGLFVGEKLEMVGNAVDGEAFYKALFDSLARQDEKGEKDHSGAYREAVREVTEINPVAGCRVITGYDEYLNTEFEAYQAGVDGNSESKNNEVDDWEKDYFELKVNSPHYELFKDAYDRFRGEYKKQPTQKALWASFPVLCPEYQLKYDDVSGYHNGAGYGLPRSSYKDIFRRAFPKLVGEKKK